MSAQPMPRVRAPEVMVSYSSQDRDRVMQFVRALRASGVAVWIDQGGIDGAQRWSEEIVNAIEACRIVLLFISRTSTESQNIAKEVALAWEGGKHFLPLALEEAKIPKSMQYQLAGIQYVKLYEGDPDVKFESVLRALVRLGVRVSPYSMAVVSAGIGDREQALEWLEKACEERSAGLARLQGEPRFNFLRPDSRFQEIARRAEELKLELEEATAEIVLPQPLSTPTQSKVSTGPVPAWKRLLWPDIADAKSAREAAGQGVWAAISIIVCRWILSFIVSTPMMTAQGWWDDPIVWTVLWGAIVFGVQKMGRPAAMIGTGLCVLGAWFNLQMLSVYKAAMQAQELTERMGQNYTGPVYSGLYYSSLFGVVAGIVFVIAFVNASRGTLAYRQLVAARKTEDKQNALSPQDLLGFRRKALGTVQRVWGMGQLATATARPEDSPQGATAPTPIRESLPKPVATEPASIAQGNSAAEAQSVIALAPATAQPIAVTSSERAQPATAERIDQFPTFDDAPEVHTFGDLIGARPFRILRVLAFFTANLATGAAFMLARTLLDPAPLHPVYWQFAVLRGVSITLATVLSFRLLRSGWSASIASALISVGLLLTIAHSTLGTFTIADVVYREQFQEFVLIPFADILLTMIGLYYAVPRVRPLALGLFVGAAGAEVLTSLLIAMLRDLGAGAPPDPVLAGTLVFFVGVRSLIFAVIFWGGLKATGIGHARA